MENEEGMKPNHAPVIRLTMRLSLLALLAVAFLAAAAACGQASPATPTPVREVTASALTRAYQNDPERAAEKYEDGHLWEVRGVVAYIEIDGFLQEPGLLLDATGDKWNDDHVDVRFPPSAQNELHNYSDGDRVRIACKPEGYETLGFMDAFLFGLGSQFVNVVCVYKPEEW